ncbi:polyadenylate-binding protein 8-like [Primulina eburnea]|uniref:polyadenylate-binding protein 8-like n=1 Tax=Primulina eburnea TaxID=1245227 RepID=UPI003C6CB33E
MNVRPCLSCQPGFGFQQQLVPGMLVSMVQQGPQGPHPGGRRANGVPMQQGPQPVPVMQQPMLPRGRGYRYPPVCSTPDVSLQGMAGSMIHVPYEMGGVPLREAGISQPIPIGALESLNINEYKNKVVIC